MLRHLSDGVPMSLTVTLVDGLVLARSVFNHSMNYRSVVILGAAIQVTDPEEKRVALNAFVDKVIPGRWNDARQPTEKELIATSVLRIALDEMSAKVRSGPVEDDPDDYTLDVWAGVVPLRQIAGDPIRDDRCDPKIPTPPYAAKYKR
jgi:nitroimidazol reductase NimA-like FMN-containing flavoprotein (pyridoxamine 5'-phosphate oxidase superfamily)